MQPLAATAPPRTLRVETPEQVDLGFEIADLGSRFIALFVDLLLIMTAVVGIGLLAAWVGRLDLSPLAAGWGLALTLFLIFLLTWGYFVVWEGYANGRTPGKRWSGVRVIHEGGHPLTLRGAAIRNLVRVVDAQPAFTWIVGGSVMMLHPRTQRLGDLAASTLVIRDRGAAELTDEELEQLVTAQAAERPALADEEFEPLDRFVARRSELSREARSRLVTRLAETLADRLPAAAPDGSGAVAADQTTAAEERLVALWEAEALRRATTASGRAGSTSPLAASLARSRAASWLEYRRLVERATRLGLADLSAEELERFAALYRATAADLARARTYQAAWPLVFSLERWVGAGHNLLYRPTDRSWRRLVEWLRHGFPALVRARIRYVATAAAMLVLPGLGVYTAVRVDPDLARALVPHGMIARAETAPERARRGGEYVEVPEVFMPVMSSGIIANNVQVTFFAFAGGILAGLGTALILVINGVSLGAVFGLFHNHGAATLLWAFVAPHGVIELTAIFIAGGAGLLLGSGLLFPGRLARARALAERAREAVSLLAGTTLLLVLAGLIEGFVSPARIPVAAKLMIAASVAIALLAYLVAGGRPGAGAGRKPGRERGRGRQPGRERGRGGGERRVQRRPRYLISR